MLGCKPLNTPMESTIKLETKEDCGLVDKGKYQMFVGKLIYLSPTILDLGYSINRMSQFMNNRNKEHIEVVYRGS